jgi:hypothetical protein
VLWLDGARTAYRNKNRNRSANTPSAGKWTSSTFQGSVDVMVCTLGCGGVEIATLRYDTDN